MRFSLFFAVLIESARCFEVCTFNDGICQWDIEPPWNVVALARLPRHPTLLTSPDVITSDGPFLLAQGKFGSTRRAEAITQKLPKSDHIRILAYRYQRRGRATLRILLRSTGNDDDDVVLDTISPSESQQSTWQRRSAILPPIRDDGTSSLVFECDDVATAEDVVAVDDVDVTSSANVVWAGQDSTLFDEQDIRRRETRRTSKLSRECTPLACQFRATLCSWHGANIQALPKKIVNEAAGESSLTSPPVRIPDGPAHLQIQMFDSQGSASTVSYRLIGSTVENEVWKKKTVAESSATASPGGWTRIHVALSSVPRGIPVVFTVKSITGADDFVAFASIDLVDDQLKTISCDQVASPVQPHSSQLLRLTALQNLQMSPIESLLYQPPIVSTSSSPFPAFPITSSPPLLSFKLDEPPKIVAVSSQLGSAPVAVLPISPAQVSARGIPIVPVGGPFSAPLTPLFFHS